LPHKSSFEKRHRSETFSPLPALKGIFVVTFLNSHCAKKERKCPQEWEGRDTWNGSKETCLQEPAFLLSLTLFQRERLSLTVPTSWHFIPILCPTLEVGIFLFKKDVWREK
jgi:hypothetical protein